MCDSTVKSKDEEKKNSTKLFSPLKVFKQQKAEEKQKSDLINYSNIVLDSESKINP